MDSDFISRATDEERTLAASKQITITPMNQTIEREAEKEQPTVTELHGNIEIDSEITTASDGTAANGIDFGKDMQQVRSFALNSALLVGVAFIGVVSGIVSFLLFA